MILLTDEEVAKIREALTLVNQNDNACSSFVYEDSLKFGAALAILDAAPTVEQVAIVATTPINQMSIGWQILYPLKHNTPLYARRRGNENKA